MSFFRIPLKYQGKDRDNTAGDVKLYRRHKCTKQHRTYAALAKCIFGRAYADGEGEWGVVRRCRPNMWALELWECRADAELSLRHFNSHSCCGVCCGDHELIRLSLT